MDYDSSKAAQYVGLDDVKRSSRQVEYVCGFCVRLSALDPGKIYEQSREVVGYVPRDLAGPDTYRNMGFRCGLEIHQQLKTDKKLFCRCPAGLYQRPDEYDAEIVRHMRPTLSELGEYDGTALMEFKTRKNIIYRIKNDSACTYESDDTPPFFMNSQALRIAMRITLLLKANIVGEVHIIRKQYLDGSIPTGFQRTAIVGIEGHIRLSTKNLGIIQVSIEEDSCREVSDIGHDRTFMTDRLGIPLVEIVTYPDLHTPDEAAEAGRYLWFLTRSTGQVNTGIGAGRQDVNVSVTGGTRVEIKGVDSIRRIPELTHNEAFRQKALLAIRDILNKRIPDRDVWKITQRDVTSLLGDIVLPTGNVDPGNVRIIAINLPEFAGLLSFFTQPGGITFADELSGRLRVVACLVQPNMTHSEASVAMLIPSDLSVVRKTLGADRNDAQVILWGPKEDIATAIETIDERCRLAFEGVPNETRKALPDGSTIFERVLPGPDRMYPDTDSSPIPVEEDAIRQAQEDMPDDVADRMEQMRTWNFPADTFTYILKRNLYQVAEKAIREFRLPPSFVASLLGHQLKHIEGQFNGSKRIDDCRLVALIQFAYEKALHRDILRKLLPVMADDPEMTAGSALETVGYKSYSTEEILAMIPELSESFQGRRTSKSTDAEVRWIMGQLKPMAIGNMDLAQLRTNVEGYEGE